MNIFHAPIDKENTQRLCNTLYSIMIGLSFKTILSYNNLYNMPVYLYFIILSLFIYFILDWLSYNTVSEIDQNTIKHISLLFYILSIISLGILPVLATHLLNNNGELLEYSTAQFKTFAIFLSAYILLTGAVGHCLINNEIKRIITSSENNSDGNNIGFLMIDYFTKALAVGIIFALFLCAEKSNDIALGYLISLAILTIGKFVRYEKWLLPKIKKINNEL